MNKVIKLILLVLLLGAVFYAYNYDSSKKKVSIAIQEDSARIFDFEPKDVKAIELNNEGNTIYAEKNDKGSWEILKPLKDKGDKKAIDGLLEALSEIRSIKEISSWKDNLDAYGLENPSLSFKLFGGTNDAPLVSAEIGLDSVMTNAVYVKIENNPNLHYVTGRIKTTIKRQPYELRNKKLVEVPPQDIQKVEVQRGKNKIIVQKKSDRWTVSYPRNGRSSENIVYSLISQINSITIKKFVSDEKSADDLKKYRLNRPALVFKATGANGDLYEVDISKVKDDRGMFLTTNGRGGIYYAVTDILPKLPEKDLDVMERRVLPLYIHDMGKVVLKNTRGEITFKEDESRLWWGYVNETKYPLNSFAVQKLFGVAVNVKADDFVDYSASNLSRCGLNRPKATFTAFDKKGNKLGKLFIGNLNKSGIKAYCKNESFKEIAIIDMVYVRDWFGREPDFYISKTEKGDKEDGVKK